MRRLKFITLFTFVLCLFVPTLSKAEDFKSLLIKVEAHPNILSSEKKYLKRSYAAEASSALKDPSLKFSALNVPKSDLSFSKTPMSSRQIAIMQRLPLTTRLAHLSDQANYIRSAGENWVQFQKAAAKASLWELSAKLESLNEQLRIVNNSLSWIKKVDRSTQRLYSSGKTSQINLLEIKVRKSELQSQLANLNHKLTTAMNNVGYLVGKSVPISVQKIPWERLFYRKANSRKDSRELSLIKESKAAQAKLDASELSYVPDITLGAAYSMRENIDGHGDFISGFVQFSIPIWGEKGSKVDYAKADNAEKNARLATYQLQKKNQNKILTHKITTLKKELQLTSKSIEFAELERKLATKRYSLGRMSIFELLEVELRLRKKKSKKEVIKEKLRTAQIELLLLQGDSLDV